MWAIVDVAEKERLKKKAAKLSEVYMKEKADYEAAIPKAPKWPKSAYVVFMTEQRAKVWKNNPDLKLMDITKVGSNRVNHLTVDMVNCHYEKRINKLYFFL